MVVAVQFVALEPLDNMPVVAEGASRVIAAGIEL